MNNKVVIGGNLKLKNVVSGQAKLNNVISGTPNMVFRGGGGGGQLSDAVKEALLDCFEHVAWIDDDGQVYYQALYDALYAKVLSSISAVFEQGQAVIYDDDTLDDLKQYLTVTANYDDGTTATINTYTLSGTLNPGTSSIQVSYENKKAYFNVIVTHRPGVVTITNTLNGCTTSNSATSMTEGASYSATITASSGYVLTGATVSITMGGVDITSSAYSNGTISIAEVTGSLVITITAVAVTLASISAVYTQSGTVYDTDSLDSLKTDLVVTATYSDSSTATVPSADYTLSGTLTAGTSTITVSYGGKTTTFTVTVTHDDSILGYVSENAIMILDGIANGTGGTHESTITTLVDQSGNGYDWETGTGTVTATDDALVFDGSSTLFGKSTWASGALTTPKTIEVVVDVTTPSTTQCIACGIDQVQGTTGVTAQGTLGVKSSNLLNHTGNTHGCIPITSGIHTYSFVNNNGTWTGYKDGSAVTFGSTSVSWNTGYKRLGGFTGASGGTVGNKLTGKLYSYRLYSEALSADDIAANRANDVARFNLS